jgi:ribonuclease P protein component
LKIYSLKKTERITSNNEFRFVFRLGQKIRTSSFEIRMVKTREKLSRLGISMSRAVGTAVFRNHLKRLVREWFRMNKIKWQQAMDMIFILRRRTEKKQFQECLGSFTGGELL